MNTQPNLPAAERFGRAAETAAAKRNAADGRAVMGVARAFLTWSDAAGSDLLHPTAEEVGAFAAARGYRQLSKVRWALRAVLNEADVLSDEHGLGTGASLAQASAATDAAQSAVAAFLSTISTRHAVWASGMRKLLRWCAEMEIDLLEVSAPDLDDYRVWIRKVGGAERELLVIARRFLTYRLSD